MSDDRARKTILARRAKFLAAALSATLPAAACDREKVGIAPDHAGSVQESVQDGERADAGSVAPVVGQPAPPATTSPKITLAPCLSVWHDPDAGASADAGTAAAPCLEVAAPPK